MTTAGIVAPMLPALGLETSVQIALAVMAIAAGAMTVSHAKDSYFWVVINFGGMTADQGYRTQTVVTLIMGVVFIAVALSRYLSSVRAARQRRLERQARA